MHCLKKSLSKTGGVKSVLPPSMYFLAGHKDLLQEKHAKYLDAGSP